MLKETLINKLKPLTSINPFVKTSMFSDSLLSSSSSFVGPIFAIFATDKVVGGNIQVAASVVSAHLITRIITEVIASKMVSSLNETKKIFVIMLGIVLVSLSYLGFAFTVTVLPLYLFWIISGIGWAIASPTKLSLISVHLDKHRETVEWGVYDAINLACMAVATTIGGVIANQYGFKLLFIFAFFVNTIGIIPFLLYLKRRGLLTNKQNFLSLILR